MQADSGDLRERIVAAVERGMSQSQAAATFEVSVSTVKRLLAKQRRGASLEPIQPSGRPRRLTTQHDAQLRAQLAADPDATDAEHTERWNPATSLRLSRRTMNRTIKRLGWTRQERRSAPVSGIRQPGSRTGSR